MSYQHPLPENLMTAASSGVLVMRPAKLRAGERYFIDATRPHLITVYLAHDLDPADRRSVFEIVDREVGTILRRRHRGLLEPVSDDAVGLSDTGTEPGSGATSWPGLRVVGR